MKETRLIMGMPVTVTIADEASTQRDLDRVFSYFSLIDDRFSTYKDTSEISSINRGELQPHEYSNNMQEIFALAEQTKTETNGYFDIVRNGYRDPSGIVKGWAIHNAAKMIAAMGYKNYFVDAGGDIQASGANEQGQPWRVGIQSPFNQNEIIKVVVVADKGIATSGTYIRGNHIYNPKTGEPPNIIVSLTVIGDSIYNADRFATAAFAMGRSGIDFIESLPNFEGYMIDNTGMATLTSNFSEYVA